MQGAIISSSSSSVLAEAAALKWPHDSDSKTAPSNGPQPQVQVGTDTTLVGVPGRQGKAGAGTTADLLVEEEDGTVWCLVGLTGSPEAMATKAVGLLDK